MTSGYDETLHATPGGPDTAPRLPAGSVFADRYEVQSLLGAGGMGAVYRVRDRKLDETVALKILTLGSSAAVERFMSEVRLARRVTHPNVARTHDLGQDGDRHFLTMEYVQGEGLDVLLARAGRLAAPRVVEIGTAIASGLEAAHRAGVVHRDLKPANVLLADDGRVVLTDFGIARGLGPAASSHHTVGVVGTPHYMSPEQVSGRPVDARSDIYALGLILFELVTGTLPFQGETALAAAVARLSQPAPDPRDRASVPTGLARLVLRCLSRAPEARPQSAKEVGVALHDPSRLVAVAHEAREPSLYAPIALGSRTLAVLPFKFRGPAEHDHLGEGLSEELIDVLTRTRGLRVLSLGATRRFEEDRDPTALCSALGATAVVDGTVQMAADKVRLAARLLQPDGVQVWSERFDGSFEDVFALQETMGQRVAEALRLELQVAAFRTGVPREAVDLYLRARSELRNDIVTAAEGAVTKLETALELAPTFVPAIASHATAAVRAWWGSERDETGVRGQRARVAVERALERASDSAETHVAVAMLAVQEGRYQEAATALADALAIAPTLFEAHEYLGRLQLEAGRPDEGRRRLELALELYPGSSQCHLALARHAVLSGDLARFRTHDEALRRLYPAPTLSLAVSRVRFGLYRGDVEATQSALNELAALGTEAAERMRTLFAPLVDPTTLSEAARVIEEVPEWTDNPRFRGFMWQVCTEVFAAAGDTERAFATLTRAAEGTTIDVEWARLCPTLRRLRSDPRFAALESAIEQRAGDVWRRPG